MKKSRIIALISAVVVILVIGVGISMYRKGTIGTGTLMKDTKSGSNVSDFTAVFLTNGQVYFGKEYTAPTGQVDLRDIFYLQVNQAIQPSGNNSANSKTTDNSNVQLVKLGNELHGPSDRMLINTQQVLFTESLKNDSKVVQAINSYKP